MKFPTVIEYLKNAGLLGSCDTQAIDEAKKERRKAYLREKKKEYRRKHTSVTLSFPKAAFRKIQSEASTHQMKVSVYLRACISVAREQTYIVPNANEVQEIELLLRRTGNHTNQIARLANHMTLTPTEALKEIRGHLLNCESILTKMFREPKRLEQYIRQELNENPVFSNVLLALIEDNKKNRTNVY